MTPGLLTLSGIFNANEYNPNQIANIAMQTARSRRGTATHFIVVKPVDGKAISLAGFQGGDGNYVWHIAELMAKWQMS